MFLQDNSSNLTSIPSIDLPSSDDGYISPEFDLPAIPDNEEVKGQGPLIQHLPYKVDAISRKKWKMLKEASNDGFEDEELLALKLLRQR